MESTEALTAKIREILPTATPEEVQGLTAFVESERYLASMRGEGQWWKLLACTRCGGTWWSYTPGSPKTCAKCNSPYWNKPRSMKR